MRFASTHQIDTYVSVFVDDTRALDKQSAPNLARAAVTLHRLASWTNRNSDGWHCWPKPARSASRLIEALDTALTAHYRGQQVVDISAADLRAALTPVKSMLTRAANDAMPDTNTVIL